MLDCFVLIDHGIAALAEERRQNRFLRQIGRIEQIFEPVGNLINALGVCVLVPQVNAQVDVIPREVAKSDAGKLKGFIGIIRIIRRRELVGRPRCCIELRRDQLAQIGRFTHCLHLPDSPSHFRSKRAPWLRFPAR